MTPSKSTAPAPVKPGESEALTRFAQMATAIPEANDDGTMLIVEQLLNAESLEGLNSPWAGSSAEELLGVPIRVNDLRRSTSDFADGLGVYLIVRGHRCDTGEAVTYATGAVNVVAQLVRAWALNLLPVTATLRQSDRPSKAGYFPQHLDLSAEEVPF